MTNKVAAVCCVYDDTRWLKASVSSVYNHVDKIFFLVSNRPWNGTEIGSNIHTLEVIESLPDPDQKFVIHTGKWASEQEQRNAGLDMLTVAEYDYCFILDADEVYDDTKLEGLMNLVFSHPEVPAWRIRMWTYWKSARYRIVPPEYYKPVIIVKVGEVHFVDNREIDTRATADVPETVCMMHHLSYARSDEEVLRKITTFGHADAVIPGWFKNVWQDWDNNHNMENLNPCWPTAYRKAIDIGKEKLPKAITESI